MRRSDLAHILRASARIAGDINIPVIGLQSILGSYDEDDLPAETWVSIEADVAYLDDPDAVTADQVDGAIGELSGFHSMYAYYAQGVEVTTAVLPDGWRDWVVDFRPRSAEPALARCLERHDLVVSKLMARRAKDYVFAGALLDAGLIDADVVAERLRLVDDAHAINRVAALSWLQRYLGRGPRA